MLALEGREGRSCEERYNRHLSCEPTESYWQSDLQKQLVLALKAMPDARRMATLDRLFDETKQPERPFLGVATVERPEYRERAARLLVRRFGEVMHPHTLHDGLAALPAGSLSSFRAALREEKPDPKLFEVLKKVFNHAEVDALMQEGGVVEEKRFPRLLRLARERVAAGAPSTRIYLLERADLDDGVPAPTAGSFSRARGDGPAIDPAALELGEREHILTLDLTELPELARPGSRALALYAASPSTATDGRARGWWRCRKAPRRRRAASPSPSSRCRSPARSSTPRPAAGIRS